MRTRWRGPRSPPPGSHQESFDDGAVSTPRAAVGPALRWKTSSSTWIAWPAATAGSVGQSALPVRADGSPPLRRVACFLLREDQEPGHLPAPGVVRQRCSRGQTSPYAKTSLALRLPPGIGAGPAWRREEHASPTVRAPRVPRRAQCPPMIGVSPMLPEQHRGHPDHGPRSGARGRVFALSSATRGSGREERQRRPVPAGACGSPPRREREHELDLDLRPSGCDRTLKAAPALGFTHRDAVLEICPPTRPEFSVVLRRAAPRDAGVVAQDASSLDP